MTRKRKRPLPWLPLATRRLILREFRQSDLDDIHAYGSDAEVTRFMPWGPNTESDTRAFLDRMLEAQKTWPRPAISAAVELAGEGRVIGAIELRQIDTTHRTGEFGYSFGRSHWGQGYAAEAAAAMMAQGFETLGLRRLTATCDVRNRGSWRVMEKLGMRREACFRKDALVKQRWRDTYLYALLASEWRARKARVASSSS